MAENHKINLPFTTSHAFIIGIDDYEHVSSLKTAVNDATKLAEKLGQDHGYQVYPPLLNATKAQMEELLQHTMVELVGPEDRVFFYFAGHGIALNSDDNPQGYFVPADARGEAPETLVSMDLLHDVIEKLPCKHGLLIMDCCFAGSFKWSTGQRSMLFDLPAIIYEERFYQYAKDPAWQVITSSASDQKAVDILSNRTLGLRSEEGVEHSPFAQALLEGLDGEADTVPKDKGDGVITTTELYSYLRDRVEDETMEQGLRQSPSMFPLHKHDKGQFIFLHPRHPQNLPPIPRRNPFMGLKSYEEEDTQLFFGRDRVIEALDELSSKHQLVVVSGVSGTGKSSVIKAGLLPLLRKKGWQILPKIRPGKEPMKSLQVEIPDLSNILNEDEQTLLIVDQYEELITQCLHPEDRVAFEEQLKSWLSQHSNLHIIISIRSDFEPQFEDGILADWWQAGHYIVPAFSPDELREVIIKPTIQEVLFFEPDSLVDKLVDAVNQAPGALPLLSFTLSELYHAYVNGGRTNRALTLEDYDTLGGVIGALRTRANAIYDELDEVNQDSMRKLMLRMVSLEGGELASRRVLNEDLVFSDEAETARVEALAQQLVDARLVATGRDKEERIYYEPAHDALVRAWARLWEWIKAMGEGKMGLMYKLSLAVGDYEVNKDTSEAKEYLWNDDPYLDLLAVDLETDRHQFNAREEAFLLESLRVRKQNRRRRRMLVTAVMVVLLGISGIALLEGKAAAREAARANEGNRLARSSSLAILASNVVEKNSTVAIQLAAESHHLVEEQPSFSSLQTLYTTYAHLDKHPFKQVKINGEAFFSPEGDMVICLMRKGGGHIYDLGGNKTGELAGCDSQLVHAVFSPDGTQILGIDKNDQFFVWSKTGEVLCQFTENLPEIKEAHFSAENKYILLTTKESSPDTISAVFSPNAFMITLDEKNNHTLHSISDPHRKVVQHIALSPDESRFYLQTYHGVSVFNPNREMLFEVLCSEADSPQKTMQIVAQFEPENHVTIVTTSQLGGTWDREGQAKNSRVATYNTQGELVTQDSITVRLDYLTGSKNFKGLSLKNKRVVSAITELSKMTSDINSMFSFPTMVRVFDFEGEEVCNTHDQGLTSSFAKVSTDESFALNYCGSLDHISADVWDLKTGKKLKVMQEDLSLKNIHSFDVSADLQYAITTTHENNGLKSSLWYTGIQEVQEVPIQEKKEKTGLPTFHKEFSADGKFYYIQTGRNIVLYDQHHAVQKIFRMNTMLDPKNVMVKFMPNNRQFLFMASTNSFFSGKEANVLLYDFYEGDTVWVNTSHNYYDDIAVSPDGTLFFILYNNKVEVYYGMPGVNFGRLVYETSFDKWGIRVNKMEADSSGEFLLLKEMGSVADSNGYTPVIKNYKWLTPLGINRWLDQVNIERITLEEKQKYGLSLSAEERAEINQNTLQEKTEAPLPVAHGYGRLIDSFTQASSAHEYLNRYNSDMKHPFLFIYLYERSDTLYHGIVLGPFKSEEELNNAQMRFLDLGRVIKLE